MSFRSLATCPKVQGLYGQNVMRPVSAFRPKWLRCKKGDENETLRSLAGIGSFDIVGFGVVAFDGIVCAGRGGSLGAGRSAGAAGICTAHLPRSGLFVDSGLLGFLGWLLWMARWLLGTARRLLRGDQLRLRIRRSRLWRRRMERRRLLLQPFGDQRERDQCDERLQPHRDREQHAECELQRPRRYWRASHAPGRSVCARAA